MDWASENPLAQDLDAIIENARADLEQLRGARLFVTGGTGFVGSWLLETLLWANLRLGLGASAVVLSRDPAAFFRRSPHLAGAPAFTMYQGDVRSFALPGQRFTHVVHAAAEASTTLAYARPEEMYDVIVSGMERVLKLAEAPGIQRLLFLSSGAVYGPQLPELTAICEDFAHAQGTTLGAYAEGKRTAERLLEGHAWVGGRGAVTVRLFTLVGPLMSLEHHAIGNFVRDAVADGPIRVRGDGETVRSYLYSSDAIAWLLAVLVRGECGRAYNVGSEDAYTVSAVATLVAEAVSPSPAVEIQGEEPLVGAGGRRYVPSTERIRGELGVNQTVDLQLAIRKTIEWHRSRRS